MRAALSLAVAVSLLAGAAGAQTATGQTAAPAPTQIPGADAATASKPKAGDTVSGVTVMPTPTKTCAPRDKDCIAIVVAELQRLYPEQLKQFCLGERTKAVRNQIVNDQLLDALGGNGAPTATAAPVSPIVKTACASDKK